MLSPAMPQEQGDRFHSPLSFMLPIALRPCLPVRVMSANQNSGRAEVGSAFPATRWTLVEEVRAGGESSARALEQLCSMYWYPVYIYARRSGAGPDDAEDLTQDFFARLLKRGDLGAADASKGKLRSYLLRSLKNFSISEYKKRTAQKRGGRLTIVAIDAEEAEGRFRSEPAEIEDPASLFERRWALGILEEALARIERAYAKKGQAELFAAIQPMMAGRADRGDRYADVADSLGMTAGAVQVAVHRLRKRYRGHLEDTIAETVQSRDDVAEELRHVLQVLRR